MPAFSVSLMLVEKLKEEHAKSERSFADSWRTWKTKVKPLP
jgi:hypothetical protein